MSAVRTTTRPICIVLASSLLSAQLLGAGSSRMRMRYGRRSFDEPAVLLGGSNASMLLGEAFTNSIALHMSVFLRAAPAQVSVPETIGNG